MGYIETEITKTMLRAGKNLPLRRDTIKELGKGFHPTSAFLTKRQRKDNAHKHKVFLGTCKRKQFIWVENKETGKFKLKTIRHW